VFGAGGLVLGPGDLEAVRAVHLDEARAADAAGAYPASAQAWRLALELSLAADAAEQWRRAGAPWSRAGGLRARRIIFP
jgi:hypothetical protein